MHTYHYIINKIKLEKEAFLNDFETDISVRNDKLVLILQLCRFNELI